MKYIPTLTLATLLAATIITGCGEGTESKMESSADSLTTKVETGVDNMMNNNPDEDFLSDAVDATALELKALTLGKDKGGTEVKTHATHMIADHKQLGSDVAAYIQKKNIVLQDVDTNENHSDLANTAAGKDFDKAFADKMVSDHEKVIDLFEDAQDDVKDPELKEMISKALPKLKSHLEMSKQMQTKLKGNN
ncbi:MAG TPA: DUF4142 domain-containing protein [Flavipsychrobacter sp.]|nr:DUF4142 domain-containing protein [Flavipsychrobacter sp.]